jgi:hypothetical protein
VTTRKLVGPVALAAVALVLLLSVRPLSTSRALSIWILLLAAMALVALSRGMREGDGAPGARRFEAALRRRPRPAQEPVELVRMDRELSLGNGSALHARRHLLPLLRACASARLSSRYGVELERQPEAARTLLGDEVWELIRPDWPELVDQREPGVPRPRLEAAITRLESL